MIESATRTRLWCSRLPACFWPVAFVLLAALIRSWHLDHMSIWQDEGLSFYRATQSLAELMSGRIPLGDLSTTDTHPPFYFLLLAGWFKLVGVSTWTGKWLSMLASLPSIALIWALAKRTVGVRSAVVASLLAALSPIYLWYAQEVRSYTLTMSLGLLAVYALHRAVDEDACTRARIGWGSAMVVAAAVLMWTHFLGFFVVALLGLAIVVYAVQRRGQRLVPVLAGLALVALAAVPLLPNVLWRLGLGAERDQHFVPLPVMLHDIVRGFGVGRTFAGAPGGALVPVTTTLGWLGLLLSVLYVCVLVVGIVAAWRRSHADASLLVGYLLVPVVGLFVLTMVKPVYLGPQHILLASPAFYVLVGAGLVAVLRVRRTAGLLASAIILLSMGWAVLNFYADPALAKDDLRSLAVYVNARAVPGDVLAVSDPVLERSLETLVSGVPVVAVPRMLENGQLDQRPAEAQIMPLLLEHSRVWFMTPLDDHLPWLAENALLVDSEDFHGSSIPVRVDAYELDPSLRRGTMPPRASWETDPAFGLLRLKGWEVVPDTLEPGKGARMRLVWQALGEAVPDYKVSVRLLDAKGRDYAKGDHEPYHGEYPTSAWPIAELTYEPHDLLVSPTAPPGEYQLAVSVYDPATGDVFPSEGSLVVGTVQVGRPDRALDRLSLHPQHPLSATGRGLEILGYDVPSGPWMPGAHMPVTIWWRTTDDDPFGVLGVEIVDGLGRVLASDTAPVPDASGFPEAADDFLRAGDLRTTALEIPLPAESGSYGLRLRYQPIEASSVLRSGVVPVRALSLGNVEVGHLERQHDMPIMGRLLQLDVGDHLALMGFDAPESIVPGETHDVALYWRARGDVPVGYHVTVQLVPASDGTRPEPTGPPAAQHDGVPADGVRPMTGWVPGEIVADRHQLTVPPDVTPGRYLLIAALYDPAHPASPRPAVLQDGTTRDHVLLEAYDVRSESFDGDAP